VSGSSGSKQLRAAAGKRPTDIHGKSQLPMAVFCFGVGTSTTPADALDLPIKYRILLRILLGPRIIIDISRYGLWSWLQVTYRRGGS
jgi:hypothetical protein